MKSTEFDGHTSVMREELPWLASEDILGKGDVEVTIDKCYFVKDAVFDGGRKEDVFTISFVGKKKQLVLNATNRKTLVVMFGANVKDWHGKKIKLTVVRLRAFGKMTNGLRIVNEASEE